MAFDRFVTFKIRDEGLVVMYGGRSYTELTSWGEEVLSPVVQAGFAALEGQAVILVPYNPILTEGQLKNSNQDIVGLGFQQIQIDNLLFLIDSVQPREGRRHLEVTGTGPSLVGGGL